MLILSWIWNSYPSRHCLEGVPNLTIRSAQQPGYLLQPDISDAIDVFDPVTLSELRRAAHLCRIFKTSFSRSNPVPRGQATVIRSSIRRDPKVTNNERSRVTSFLPTSNPSPILGRLGPQRVHRERARTWGKTPNLEASRSIFSSQF